MCGVAYRLRAINYPDAVLLTRNCHPPLPRIEPPVAVRHQSKVHVPPPGAVDDLHQTVAGGLMEVNGGRQCRSGGKR